MNIASIYRLFLDFKSFFLHDPGFPTLIRFRTENERKEYCIRILQRIHLNLDDFSVLNIHRIGVAVPPQFVFSELLQWDGNSSFWPNEVARVNRLNGTLEHILIHTLGMKQFRLPFLRPVNIPPLFNMTALNFQSSPSAEEEDNARYLLYECSGGYPIGIFCFFIKSSISGRGENEYSQLFSLVAFNFYGKKNWFYNKIIRPIWERIHNRVSTNVLAYMKLEFEKKFHQHQLEKRFAMK